MEHMFALDYTVENEIEKLTLHGMKSAFPLIGYGERLVADSNNTGGTNTTTGDLSFDYFIYVNGYDNEGYTHTPQPIIIKTTQIMLTDGAASNFINFFKSDSFPKTDESVIVDDLDRAVEVTETILPYKVETGYFYKGSRAYEFNATDFDTLVAQVSSKYPGATVRKAKNTDVVYVKKSDGEYVYWLPKNSTIAQYFKIRHEGTTTRLFLSKRTMDKILTKINK